MAQGKNISMSKKLKNIVSPVSVGFAANKTDDLYKILLKVPDAILKKFERNKDTAVAQVHFKNKSAKVKFRKLMHQLIDDSKYPSYVTVKNDRGEKVALRLIYRNKKIRYHRWAGCWTVSCSFVNGKLVVTEFKADGKRFRKHPLIGKELKECSFSYYMKNNKSAFNYRMYGTTLILPAHKRV